MKKNLGLILLTIGIGLSAGFGAELAPNFRHETKINGIAGFGEAIASQKHADYCKTLTVNKLPPVEGCADGDGNPVPFVDEESLAGATPVERRRAEISSLRANKEVRLLDVTQARIFWIASLEKTIPLLEKVQNTRTQAPAARLTGWFASSGMGFLLGLVFVVIGSVLCRKAHGEGISVPEGASEDGPLDFGVLLEGIIAGVRQIQSDMKALDAPTTADLDAIKVRLEDIQKGDMARICAAGPQVQQRYGLGAMAAIFSPLSGAERRLNRMWACLVDRHWPEAMASVDGAAENLEAAHEAVQKAIAA
ncbi:MAG: hypothetical protein CL930_03745 [Deltaproteobacteria bacterium]|nr:hypothetical protein [Deltaproteobacteria bacterium]